MDLSRVLQDLQIARVPEAEVRSPGDPDFLPAHPPVADVLRELQDKLRTPGFNSDQIVPLLNTMEQVVRHADPHWLFLDCCCNQGTDVRRCYADLMLCLVQHAALPLCECDSGSLPASSYQDVPPRATAVCSLLSALLDRLGDLRNAQRGSSCPYLTTPALGLTLLPLLAPQSCVLAVTHLQEAAWSSQGSRTEASSLVKTLLRVGGWENPAQLLGGSGQASDQLPGILGGVLDLLQPHLTKESWKRNEALKYVFAWVLLQTQSSCVSDHLDRLFPPSLLMSDDYSSDNKLLGVRCLHHLLRHVPAAELRQYNRAEVLHHALFNHLYTSGAPLIQVVLPCLLDLLPVLEKSPALIVASRRPNRYDTVLRLVLSHMEVEHKLPLRRVYAGILPLFIDRMGVLVVRHLKRVERVVTGYLEVCDGPEEQSRIAILDALEKTIAVAWPRMACRLSVLVRSLLRLLVDVSSEDTSAAVRQELMDRATRCLLLLDHATKGKVQTLLQDVDSGCASAPVLCCLQMVSQRH
ncbi:TELO2-interacting protein 2 [Hypomesus transpacificus]|uniref:TELO2-interacting protein 2 n=1 Tax=Hypomesus transpacificus TaxID=137520 RepID=UPI001F077CEE|nr:TELO2-interacting protein 2 [Hypomesus transpacificus]XP_046904556.1 TELO2-interacting protein 2 [Hypomesus transpacificus]